ncbi:MAG: hypothetical protein HC902_03545 [Calothrix sp. SM1_5_4]|nr:hypothetical protein [Calothrix sp. SM1_5_4]
MKLMVGFFLAIVSVAHAFAASVYPQGPDPRLTPGSYCDRPSEHRYPERIPYCNRNVDRSLKAQVIRDYNEKLGYQIDRRDRSQFKIDHLIPLCAGGSNHSTNLWPQHQTVYTVTDPLEGLACEKMARGRLTQRRAVELLMRAKNNLDEADEVRVILESL